MNEIKKMTDLTQEQIDKNFCNVVKGTLDQVLFYVDFVDNPNIPDRFGIYPIQLALGNIEDGASKFSIMQAILSKNPDVNIKDAGGRVPAMEAFARHNRGVGLLLMKSPMADLTVVDENKDGLLNYAVRTGSEKIVRTAMELKAPYLINHIGEGALLLAAKENDSWLIEAVVQGLWQRGENPRGKKDFKKALELIQGVGDKEMERALNGAQKPKEMQALHTAHNRILEGRVAYTETEAEFAKRLGRLPKEDKKWVKQAVSLCVDCGSIGERLNNVLFSQINSGTPHDVRVLLEIGADPNRASKKFGQTPLLAAIESTLRAVDHHQNEFDLPESAAYDKAEILLKAGADPWEEKNDQSPFLWALAKNRVGIGALLLNAILPEQRREMACKKNQRGDGPLKYAAGCKSSNGIKLVLQNGGDLHERGERGKRAMYWAIEAGRPDNVMALWKSGFKLDWASAEGVETKEMLEKRRHEWEFEPKTNANGDRVFLSEKEKAVRREVLYQKMVQAINGVYEGKQVLQQKTEKQKPTTLAERLGALTPEEVVQLSILANVDVRWGDTKQAVRALKNQVITQEKTERILQNKVRVQKQKKPLGIKKVVDFCKRIVGTDR